MTTSATTGWHRAIVPASLFGDCVVSTLSVGSLIETHIIVCEHNYHDNRLDTQPSPPLLTHGQSAQGHTFDDETPTMVGWWKQVVWQQGGYTRCALCTQTTPWLSTKNTDCDECEQSGMDENHTNALWPDSQPCMACCTQHLSMFNQHTGANVTRQLQWHKAHMWWKMVETTSFIQPLDSQLLKIVRLSMFTTPLHHHSRSSPPRVPHDSLIIFTPSRPIRLPVNQWLFLFYFSIMLSSSQLRFNDVNVVFTFSISLIAFAPSSPI